MNFYDLKSVTMQIDHRFKTMWRNQAKMGTAEELKNKREKNLYE